MASPNLPGDSLGVPGGGGVLGLGKSEAEAPRRDQVPLGIGGHENDFRLPGSPGAFDTKLLPAQTVKTQNPPQKRFSQEIPFSSPLYAAVLTGTATETPAQALLSKKIVSSSSVA